MSSMVHTCRKDQCYRPGRPPYRGTYANLPGRLELNFHLRVLDGGIAITMVMDWPQKEDFGFTEVHALIPPSSGKLRGRPRSASLEVRSTEGVSWRLRCLCSHLLQAALDLFRPARLDLTSE